MIPIVTPEEMAAIDAVAPEPVDTLIARAGWAVARTAVRMLGGTHGRRVVVIAGKGNNGADGRVAGELLAGRGVRVHVVDPRGRDRGSGHPEPRGSGEDPVGPADVGTLPRCDLIIDAAFGTGLTRPYEAPRPADPTTPVLAVDIPSGVSGATGQQLGEPLVADRTVTFAALKPGLICGDGPRFAGEIETVDIGLDTSSARAHLVTEPDVVSWLPARPRTTHKWRSAVRLVAGSPGMTGSADLATAGAFRAGAGYVRRSTPGIDPASPGATPTGMTEAVQTPLPTSGWATDVLEDIDRFDALAVGPGLGGAPRLARDIATIVTAPVPVVIDGDGLGALGDDPAAVLGARPGDLAPVVLTPHDGEFARLGGTTGPGTDRLAAVRDLARRTGAVVLAKGPTTVVAHPDGRILASNAGDARLATAGTGDVLTGILAAFLARGVDPLRAAAAAAWVHGRAAAGGRSVGMVASDLPGLVADLLSGMSDNG